jgi:hypothetical protein
MFHLLPLESYGWWLIGFALGSSLVAMGNTFDKIPALKTKLIIGAIFLLMFTLLLLP